MSQKNLAYFERVGYDLNKSFVTNLEERLELENPVHLTGRAAAQLWLLDHRDCAVFMAKDLETYERIAESLELEETWNARAGRHLTMYIMDRFRTYTTYRIYRPNSTVGVHPIVHELRGKPLKIPLSSVEEVLAYFKVSGGLGGEWLEDLKYYQSTGRIAPRRQRQRGRYTL